MKKFVFSFLLLAVFMLAANATETYAQSTKNLQGNWVFNVETPLGTLPAPFAFKKKGKGVTNFPGPINFVYRETGANFSLAVELLAAQNPAAQNLTVVVRGVKMTDTTIEGTVIFVTEAPDAASPAKVTVTTGRVTGRRQ
jgi:hypothetical protein